MAWAPDNRFLAAVSRDAAVRIWGLLNEQRLEMHTWNVFAEQAMADGYPTALSTFGPVYPKTTPPPASPRPFFRQQSLYCPTDICMHMPLHVV